jgi:hypothetical protein
MNDLKTLVAICFLLFFSGAFSQSKGEEPLEASVVIDAKTVTRQVDVERFLGVNVGIWYQSEWIRNKKVLSLLYDARTFRFRFPGGDISNRYNWKENAVFHLDGTKEFDAALRWEDFLEFVQQFGKKADVLLTLNIMTGSVDDALEWISDCQKRGLRVSVELGNEPDRQGEIQNASGEPFAQIETYCEAYQKYAQMIRERFPEVKILGPAVTNALFREEVHGKPWEAFGKSPFFLERFIERCGNLVDTVSFHCYPYWENTEAAELLRTSRRWHAEISLIREWIQKYAPEKAAQIQTSLSEWNSGEEKPITASLVNGLWAADFLLAFIEAGGDEAYFWDLFTQKPHIGGGHGYLDPQDEEQPFAPRATYWALRLFAQHFGNHLLKATLQEDFPNLSVYASRTETDSLSLFVINKDPDNDAKLLISLEGASFSPHAVAKLYTLDEKQYQWSFSQKRAVVNLGPRTSEVTVIKKQYFSALFPRYSVTAVVLSPISWSH